MEHICQICNEHVYSDEFFAHIVHKGESHAQILQELYMHIRGASATKYAFEIAEYLCEKDVPIESISTLTRFISFCIEDMGFNHRKKVNAQREVLIEKDASETANGNNGALIALAYSALNSEHRQYTNDECVHTESGYDRCGSCKMNMEDCNIFARRETEVTKTFTFAAAHHLPYHKGLCRFTHGHEWLLEVTVRDNVCPLTDMVIDFSDLKHVVNTAIISKLDHNYINDFVYNPTAENLCLWIMGRLYDAGLSSVSKIKLWEAPTSFATLTDEDF